MKQQPVENLSDCKAEDPIPDVYELLLNGNGVSATYYVNKLVSAVGSLAGFNIDLLTYITTKVAGDWNAIQTASIAVSDLASYNRSYSAAISTASTQLSTDWSGSAADSAGDYFSSLSTTLDAQAESLETISTQLHDLAITAYNLANGISGVIQYLGDAAAAFIAAKIAAATAEATVLGAPAGVALEAVAATQLVRVLMYWKQIVSLFGNFYTTVQGVIGLLTTTRASLTLQKIPELPA